MGKPGGEMMVGVGPCGHWIDGLSCREMLTDSSSGGNRAALRITAFSAVSD